MGAVVLAMAVSFVPTPAGAAGTAGAVRATTVAAPAAPAAPQAYQDISYPAGTIKHVVWVQLENHTFDSILGDYCTQVAKKAIVRAGADMGCNGEPIGTPVTMNDGQVLPTTTQGDIVPDVTHQPLFQQRAWNNGLDNRWDEIPGCRSTNTPAFGCMTEVAAKAIPALSGLANNYTVADNARTYMGKVGMVESAGDHLQTVTGGNLYGFEGAGPKNKTTGPGGVGEGCLSNLVAPWKKLLIPMCFAAFGLPSQDYTTRNPASIGGEPAATAATSTLVKDPNALFREASAAGDSWVQFGSTASTWGTKGNFGFYWNVCQYWASCILTDAEGATPAEQFSTEATQGTLPQISWLTPEVSGGNNSEHNEASMAFGDATLARQMNALIHGPDWSSTVVFITYDDCGCFYDHVAPNRVPLVIVSPFAKSGYTDSTLGSFAGVDRFIEETFGLGCLWTDPSADKAGDCQAYDWSGSLVGSVAASTARDPVAPALLPLVAVPASSHAFLKDVPSPIGGDES
jgi:phospholipase C